MAELLFLLLGGCVTDTPTDSKDTADTDAVDSAACEEMPKSEYLDPYADAACAWGVACAGYVSVEDCRAKLAAGGWGTECLDLCKTAESLACVQAAAAAPDCASSFPPECAVPYCDME